MSTTVDCPRPADARRRDSEGAVVARSSDDVPAQLRLLDDAYAREILAALAETPLRGRDLIERCDASRSTVYRRLDRLRAAGFVTGETTLDPDGHHCEEFRLVRGAVTVRIDDGALTVVTKPTAESST
jgi:DNA-binding transcriptional ArsR family regulator